MPRPPSPPPAAALPAARSSSRPRAEARPRRKRRAAPRRRAVPNSLRQLQCCTEDVDAQALEAQARDTPFAVFALVLLAVVAIALQPDARAVGLLIPLHVVEHRPDAARGAVTGDLDLGHVPVVARARADEGTTDVGHDLVAAGVHHLRFGDLH